MEAMAFQVAATVAAIGGSLLLFRQWMKGPRCTSTVRLDGKTVAVTGASAGIGKGTALELSRRGAKVILLCRSVERGNEAAAEIRAETGGDVVVEQMDLASFESIRQCADRLLASLVKLNILVNNAATVVYERQETRDGFELQWGTNHLGHFLLTDLLLPLIQKAAPGARIVTVSALAHEGGQIYWDDLNLEQENAYGPIRAYIQSKIANILFSAELGRRLKGTGVTTYSLHPGVIQTQIGDNVASSLGPLLAGILSAPRVLFKSVDEGIQTTLYCCLEESIAGETGRYYSDCAERKPAPHAASEEDAARLWRISQEMTGLK